MSARTGSPAGNPAAVWVRSDEPPGKAPPGVDPDLGISTWGWQEIGAIPLPLEAKTLWLQYPDQCGEASPGLPDGLDALLGSELLEAIYLDLATWDEPTATLWLDLLSRAGWRLTACASASQDDSFPRLTAGRSKSGEGGLAEILARNRAVWFEARASHLEQRWRLAEEANVALSRRVRELDRQFRDVEQRYGNLVNSQRWRLANEVAESLKQPGWRTLGLPAKLAGGFWRFAKRRLRRKGRRWAQRILGRFRRDGGGEDISSPGAAPSAARVELARRFRTKAEMTGDDPSHPGVYWIPRGEGQPESLHPNTWPGLLRGRRRGAVLLHAAVGFDSTAWVGALAGLGSPAADPLLELLAYCEKRRIPVALWAADDAVGGRMATVIAAPAAHLFGGARAVARLVAAEPHLRSRVREEISAEETLRVLTGR